jgi:hypothetical protein
VGAARRACRSRRSWQLDLKRHGLATSGRVRQPWKTLAIVETSGNRGKLWQRIPDKGCPLASGASTQELANAGYP